MSFEQHLLSGVPDSVEIRPFLAKIAKKTLAAYITETELSKDSFSAQSFESGKTVYRWGASSSHSFRFDGFRRNDGEWRFSFRFVDAGFMVGKESYSKTVSLYANSSDYRGFRWLTQDDADEIAKRYLGYTNGYLTPIIDKVSHHFESVGHRRAAVALVSVFFAACAKEDNYTRRGYRVREFSEILKISGFSMEEFLGIPEGWIANTRTAIEERWTLIEKLMAVLGALYGRAVTEDDVLMAFRAIESEIKNVSALVGQMLVDVVPKMFAFSGGEVPLDDKKFAFIGNILENLKGTEKTALVRMFEYSESVVLNVPEADGLARSRWYFENFHASDSSKIFSKAFASKVSESFQESGISKFPDIAEHIRELQFKKIVQEARRFSNGEEDIRKLLKEQGGLLKASRIAVLDSEKIIVFTFEKIGDVRIEFDTLDVASSYSTGFSKSNSGITEYGANSSAMKVSSILLENGNLKVILSNDKFVFGHPDTFKDLLKYENIRKLQGKS